MKTVLFHAEAVNDFMDPLAAEFEYEFEEDGEYSEFFSFAPADHEDPQPISREDFPEEDQRITFDMIFAEASWALADAFRESDYFDGSMPLSMEDAFDITVFWPEGIHS